MTDAPEKLERLVDTLVRGQPARRAPPSLQARVFAQIASNPVPLPRWRKGFAHWPLAARVAFLIASYGFVRFALAGVMSAVEFVRSGDIAGMATLHRTGQAVSATLSMIDLVLHAIPPLWLYAGAALGFVLYAVLFGLGTFAYRTLYVQR